MNSFAFAECNHGDLLPSNRVAGFFVIVEVKIQIFLFFSIISAFQNPIVPVIFQSGFYRKFNYLS